MEVSPECGEKLPTGKSVGVSEVENEDIEEPIPGQRETKRERLLFNHQIGLAFIADQLTVSRVREGLVLGDAPVVSAFGWLFRAAKRVAAMEHSRALRLQGRRPLVPMCRSVGEAGDWGGGRDFAAPAKERMSRLRQQYQRSLGDRC
ncbi:hypothetical protein BHE74_00044412 [Ensete ventricosum]|nr:hypothetical protein BHE74_00044412 [Ensete ventricosum]